MKTKKKKSPKSKTPVWWIVCPAPMCRWRWTVPWKDLKPGQVFQEMCPACEAVFDIEAIVDIRWTGDKLEKSKPIGIRTTVFTENGEEAVKSIEPIKIPKAKLGLKKSN